MVFYLWGSLGFVFHEQMKKVHFFVAAIFPTDSTPCVPGGILALLFRRIPDDLGARKLGCERIIRTI